MTLKPDFIGKVRDTFRLGDGRLLIVATDRISVFDVVLGRTVPKKGATLVGLTKFWLERHFDDIPNHLITTDVSCLDPEFFELYPDLQGRGMIVREARILPVECIVRGYLEGSGLKEYNKLGTVTGIPLPSGLERASRLPEVLFTPSTKAEQGEHDENITFEQMVEILGDRELAERVRETSLELYMHGAHHALNCGAILADTKFEFGIDPDTGELLLCDEVLTGDSSRFWELATWEPGKAPRSFDKQPVRDYFEREHPEWDKTDPAPPLPDEVIEATTADYLKGYEMLTGEPLAV